MLRNVHERHLSAPAASVGALIDTLAGPDDRLWPHDRWPHMRFDRPLAVGAVGGHGPVRYDVREYEPGVRIRFGFLGPRGFVGYHEFAVSPSPDGCRLRHTMVLEPHGPAVVSWPLVFRPLHDALIEDSLFTASRSLGLPAEPPRWSGYVRFLRRLVVRRPSPLRQDASGAADATAQI